MAQDWDEPAGTRARRVQVRLRCPDGHGVWEVRAWEEYGMVDRGTVDEGWGCPVCDREGEVW